MIDHRQAVIGSPAYHLRADIILIADSTQIAICYRIA